MSTLSKALLLLVCFLFGVVATFVAIGLYVRAQGPCSLPPCDGGPMLMFTGAVLLGPFVGLAMGAIVLRLLNRRNLKS